MEQAKESALKCAQMLQRLAILKNQERSEKQIAAMAAYLTRYFTLEELTKATEYLLQRSPFFPDISEYFKLLKPISTPEARAIELKAELDQTLKDCGFNYQKFNLIAKQELKDFVGLVGWNKAGSIYDKDAIELFKGIINRNILRGTNEKQIEQ